MWSDKAFPVSFLATVEITPELAQVEAEVLRFVSEIIVPGPYFSLDQRISLVNEFLQRRPGFRAPLCNAGSN